ncbi:ROK family protein [Vibrio sp. S9_S30]|uniref:ROK family protein n=1 Tax=Vibrio sp. S9_S30 TaxID=2720226 RepID=UPI0016802C8A|nr:ROK family protein [Vibrio sp. S9_S30]MBD1556618.1 ROK family protein [Vibrio sp. S9_S30]
MPSELASKASNNLSFCERLATLLVQFDSQLSQLSDKRKNQLLGAIFSQPSPTRKSLSQEYRLRPATVTELVGELIELGLVIEDKTINPSKPGRPEVFLRVQPNALSGIVITIDSLTIYAHLINLKGEVVSSSSKTLDDLKLSNQQILEQFETLANTLIQSSPESNVVGITCSLPGLVDEENVRWVYANRWPEVTNLSFEPLSKNTKLPVKIAKNLNNELRARLLRHPENRKESVLNIHWGYGIGTSYALRGQVLHTPIGGFGELGQTSVFMGDKLVTVESIASLRAIEGELKAHIQDVPVNEAGFEEMFTNKEIADLPVIDQAIELMSATLMNAFLVLFPQQIVITGPFAQSPEIFKRLEQRVAEKLPPFVSREVTLHVGQRAKADEIFGALSPLFQTEIIGRLKSR